MFPATAIMSSTFVQDGLHSQGQSMPSRRDNTERNVKIDEAMESIDRLAKSSSLNDVITTMLSRSIPAMKMYITGQNEVPGDDVNQLALQCALLRLADTAVMAQNLDISDYDATRLLEASEDEILQKGYFQSKYILPYEVQAAINFVIDEIIQKHKRAGGTGKMLDIATELKASAPGNYFMASPDASMELMQNGGGGGGVTYYDDHPNLDNYEFIKGDTYNTTETLVKQQTGGSGVLDFIDKAIEVVKDATGAINTIADNTGNAIDSVKDKLTDIGGDLAAGSLKKALMKNLPLILGIFAIITVVILIVVYAAKSKSR
jgi:hypothetical protein